MNKLTKTANILDVFFKIARIVIITALVAGIVSVAIIGITLLSDIDPNAIGTGFAHIDLGYLELVLADAAAPTPQAVLIHTIITTSLALLACVSALLFVNHIRAILKPMKEGKPFHATTANHLKKLAWLELIMGIFYNMFTIVESFMITHWYNIPQLLVGGNITQVFINHEIDLSFLLYAGVLFLTSYIFQYGTELQTLSDETL